MTLNIEITKNGKPHILYRNNKYRQSYTTKNGEVVWRCLGSSCKATLKTDTEKNQIIACKNTHTGSHPTALRSPRPSSTPVASTAAERVATPAAASGPSALHTGTSPTPAPHTHQNPSLTASTPRLADVITRQTQVSSLPAPAPLPHSSPSPSSSPPTPPTNTDTDLVAENAVLKNQLAKLKSDMEIILDHSIESDQRLLRYTTDVFTPITPSTYTLNQAVQTDPTLIEEKQKDEETTKSLNSCILSLQNNLVISKSKIADLEKKLKEKTFFCEKCAILKDESSKMIQSIRALEAEIQILRNDSEKDCTQTPCYNIPLKNRFSIFEENFGDKFEPFLTVVNSKKTVKKYTSTNTTNNNKKKKKQSNINKQAINIRSQNTPKGYEHSKKFPVKPKMPYKDVTIIGDSHARHLASMMLNATNHSTNISGVCKPNAGLLDIVPSPPPKHSSSHCYIVLAGTNDVSAGRQDIIFSQIEKLIQDCTRTSKVLMTPLFHRYDLPSGDPIHRVTSLINNYMAELCDRYEGADLLDVSSLRRSHFTQHGLHLRTKGKQLLTDLFIDKLSQHIPCSRRLSAEANRPLPATPHTPGPGELQTLPFATYADAVQSSSQPRTTAAPRAERAERAATSKCHHPPAAATTLADQATEGVERAATCKRHHPPPAAPPTAQEEPEPSHIRLNKVNFLGIPPLASVQN